MALTPILQISGSWIVLPFNIGLGLIVLFAAERLVFVHRPRIVLAVVPVVAVLMAAIGMLPFQASNAMALGIMLPLFFAAVLLGLPVSFAMMLGSLFFLQVTDSAPLIAAAQNTVDGTSHFILLTLPFFIWAGLIMEKGGISVRLVRFAMALVGHLRGGLLQVAVVTIYLVSGISGSKARRKAPRCCRQQAPCRRPSRRASPCWCWDRSRRFRSARCSSPAFCRPRSSPCS
jgi:hypothetical protein